MLKVVGYSQNSAWGKSPLTINSILEKKKGGKSMN